MRQSNVAYIVACIRVDSTPHFLLLHHKKWKDWSLVGGKLETKLAESWADAAARETQEELPPLKHRKDFVLFPIFSTPVTWGPERSLSAGNEETMYQAQFFSLEFLDDPSSIFSRLVLDVDELRLVPQDELEHSANISKPIKTLVQRLRGGLTSIPMAWEAPVARIGLPQRLFEGIPKGRAEPVA